MAYWGKTLKYTIKPGKPFTIGEGENTFLTPFEIKRGESTYSRNVSSRNYPALSVRPGRALGAFTAITTPNAFGQRNNQYPHVQDATIWKRWDGSAWQNVQTGLTSATGKFLEFNTEATRFTILANGTNTYSWNGSAAASIAGAPATKLYTVDDYRLYALLNSVLSCTAAGSVTDWTTADDADSIALTGMVGVGTAITSYNDTVISWGEQSMHVLYGNDPYDFELSDPMEYGCISDKSVVELNGILYFLDYGKYMRYNGGRPQEMSQKARTYLEGIATTYKGLCVAGKSGKYIYLSIPYGAVTANNVTLEFDTENDTVYPIDQGYVGFVNINEYLYGVASDGKFYTINSGTTNAGSAIAWSFITGVINHNTVSQKKVLSDLWAVVDLPAASTLLVYYSTTVDADDFTLLYTFTGSTTEQTTRIQVPTTALQNVNYYRLKFAGTGPCTIHALEENLRIKPR
ncbi:MAG: hypothetical protein WC616_02405 [Candidatus Omnitrophota bacterium]